MLLSESTRCEPSSTDRHETLGPFYVYRCAGSGDSGCRDDRDSHCCRSPWLAGPWCTRDLLSALPRQWDSESGVSWFRHLSRHSRGSSLSTQVLGFPCGSGSADGLHLDARVETDGRLTATAYLRSIGWPVPGVRIPPSPYGLLKETKTWLPARSGGIPNPRGRERQLDSPFGLSSSERSELSQTAKRGRQLAEQDARIPPLSA